MSDHIEDKPKRQHFQFSLITFVLFIVVGTGLLFLIVLPAIGRAREAARSSNSARNMNALGKTMLMYYEIPANNCYPAHLEDLYRDYVPDWRVFIRPGFSEEDAGYVYIPGSSPADATNIVLYENVPEQLARNGRNVLFASTNDEFLSESEFQIRLKQTEANLKSKGIEMKIEPVKAADAKKRY
jgi:hypothetical protein